MFMNRNHGIMLLSIAAIAVVGCHGGDGIESTAEHDGSLITEVHVTSGKRIVFVDEGDGHVGVAEISSMGEAPIVTDMIQREHATPLEIFLAAAPPGEDAPEILIENHRDLSALQGREDLEPRRLAAISSLLGTLSPNTGVTPCTAAGWENVGGVWGNEPDGVWDVEFTNTTTPHTNETSYPAVKSITQLAAWNGGSGSYHTHGACISSDAGADDKITFIMKVNNVQVYSVDLFEKVGNDDWVTYTDYFNTGNTSRSEITNASSASATFRHSAAAWVPFPG